MISLRSLLAILTLIVITGGTVRQSLAQEFSKDAPAKKEAKPLPEPVGAKLLSPRGGIWLDLKKKQIILDGYVCLRRGPLEMFACPRGSKEHESVVAVVGRPRTVHTGLLAIGAVANHPAIFEPEYKPASGTEIDIRVQWRDDKGKIREVAAQQWVRNVRTKKALAHPWVFSGSGFWKDEETGKQYYEADSGDFICVSNFPTATLDLPIPSSQANDALLYEAFTEHIPALKTKVRLILSPKLKPAPKPKSKTPKPAAKSSKVTTP